MAAYTIGTPNATRNMTIAYAGSLSQQQQQSLTTTHTTGALVAAAPPTAAIKTFLTTPRSTQSKPTRTSIPDEFPGLSDLEVQEALTTYSVKLRKFCTWISIIQQQPPDTQITDLDFPNLAEHQPFLQSPTSSKLYNPHFQITNTNIQTTFFPEIYAAIHTHIQRLCKCICVRSNILPPSFPFTTILPPTTPIQQQPAIQPTLFESYILSQNQPSQHVHFRDPMSAEEAAPMSTDAQQLEAVLAFDVSRSTGPGGLVFLLCSLQCASNDGFRIRDDSNVRSLISKINQLPSVKRLEPEMAMIIDPINNSADLTKFTQVVLSVGLLENAADSYAENLLKNSAKDISAGEQIHHTATRIWNGVRNATRIGARETKVDTSAIPTTNAAAGVSDPEIDPTGPAVLPSPIFSRDAKAILPWTGIIIICPHAMMQ